ncbi:response regulator [Halarchaeum sp. P4]|uniref:response regulator n=1 Tax=Halarchaeum sp. P4 TaxID=3421639 RepID=UPI003EBB6273
MTESNSGYVLVVDDDRAFADLTAAHLRSALPQVAVEVRADPQAALARLDHVDAVVSDHDMPTMTGIGLLRVVRRREEDLPFVLFTGTESPAVRSGAGTAGATACINKHEPDAFQSLVHTVERSLG